MGVDESVTKNVAGFAYVLAEHVDLLKDELRALAERATRLADREATKKCDVIRIDQLHNKVAFLNYPEFYLDPFPSLLESWLVDLDNEVVSYRTYEDSLNPPILHRKELLLKADDPRRSNYKKITKAAESIGLFDDPKRIGYQRQWFTLIREKGYRFEGESFVPIGNEDAQRAGDQVLLSLHSNWNAARQLTALVRYGFSAPIQSLARHGYLTGKYSIFDYGCGKGDDVRGLLENGLPAIGWDPFYAPENPKNPADIVNLGFVINVIEDFDERLEAVTGAWELTKRILVVSVMLSNKNDIAQRAYQDGVLTQRGTFQKYYTQPEIKQYLESVLNEEVVPVAPGVLYVFRDKDEEQRFLSKRYRSRRISLCSPSVVRRSRTDVSRERKERKYAAHRESLDRLWEQWVSLGRIPDKTEVYDLLALVEGFGTLSKALRFIGGRNDLDEVERAKASRIADLNVYLALNVFCGRKPYKYLEMGLQRDIRAFYGSYQAAQREASDLLFGIANVEAIGGACQEAAHHGLGSYEESESLQLHTSMVEQLPALLRVYVGCAAIMYGDYNNADIVKIHIHSGKVSLMRYDNFEGSALPRMVERVKIKLREQDIDYFVYGDEYESPYLYKKSRYINEEYPNYPEQVMLEEKLDDLGIFDFRDYGPRPEEFEAVLKKHRWRIDGFSLIRSNIIPDLDDPCGQYLTYRQLIECGETQIETGISNLPKQIESYNSLYDLALHVLDPVIDYFGMIHLTYGFCSNELSLKIPGRIDPKRDQHAANERNRLGNVICARLGAAADFIVEDESMLEVAKWVVSNTNFDRLYFYGDARPIHVSYGPNHDRQIVRMVEGKSGNILPKVTSIQDFTGMGEADV